MALSASSLRQPASYLAQAASIPICRASSRAGLATSRDIVANAVSNDSALQSVVESRHLRARARARTWTEQNRTGPKKVGEKKENDEGKGGCNSGREDKVVGSSIQWERTGVSAHRCCSVVCRRIKAG